MSNVTFDRLATRRLMRGGAATLLAGALALGGQLASAHVRVTPDTATAGGYAPLTFRVPNESDTAGTTKVEITLPSDTPLLSVSTKPVPGWKATVTKTKLAKPVENHGATLTEAPSRVTWTAQGDTQIRPGEFQEFAISAGPFPDTGTLVLAAKQTYSDGEVVDWDQLPAADGEEPERPAPVITVQPAAEGDGHGHGAASPSPSAEGAADSAAEGASNATSGVDPVGRGLGAAGLVLGLAALVLAMLRRSAK